MQAQDHIIKKFSFELQTQGVQQSYALQKKCIKIVNENLLLGMDKVLSAHFSADEIIRIKKIEIDLGNISSENLEKDFAAKCLESFISTIKAIPAKQQVSDTKGVNIISEAENYLQQFFYFLAEGKKLWTVQHINFRQWQDEIIKAAGASPILFKAAFIKLMQQHKVALKRLLLQFDDDFVLAVAALFETGITDDIHYAIPGIKINTKYIKDVIAIKTIPVKNAIAVLLKNIIPVTDAIQTKVTLTELAAVETAEKNISIEKTTQEAADNGIYIDNAGMIILHPFLQNFFTATELMDGNNFKNDSCKQKAVHLLQYLVNGEQETPEYMMPLNKILCGIPGEDHIERFVVLTKNEKQEAAALLQSVLAHWKNLKNTSPEALQETFFQRKGKLTFNEANGYWKLQVERTAVDILLDRIPWGISYIQLPWMQYALGTEW